MKIRLESYYKQVTQFDCLDKTLINSFKNPSLINLTNSVVNLDRSSIKIFLIIESIFNKNLELNYFKQKKLSPSVSTLRGKDLFVFLDLAFNCCINIEKPKSTAKQQPLLLPSTSYNYFNLPYSVKLTTMLDWTTLPKQCK